MKPGTLFALNRNLCLRLEPDLRYVWRSPAPLLRPLTVPAPDTRPVEPALARQAGPDPAPGRGLRSVFRRTLFRAGLLALLITANLGLLGFERIERSRERHFLGRAIAEREQRTQWLIEMNRHIVGVVRVQHALLQQGGSGAAEGLARVSHPRRVPAAGI